MQEDSRIFSSGKTFLLDVGIRGVSKHTCVCVYVCVSVFCLRFEPKALCILGKCSTTELDRSPAPDSWEKIEPRWTLNSLKINEEYIQV